MLKSTVAINLEGAFFAVQAAARQMSTQSPMGGSIIGISSISALVGGAGRTQLNDEDLADDAKREYVEGRIPLGRLGQPPVGF